MPYITVGLSHIRISECMWVGSVGACGSAGWECGSVRVWVCVWVYLLLSVYLLLGPFSLHLSLGMWVGNVGVWKCGRVGVGVWVGSVSGCGSVGWECGSVRVWVYVWVYLLSV
ncbi:hypothetical protein RhiirA4_429968 [Rhizophagus irregularis]|uniref:Uncharacterized protein n=1 Tax=Rhizophagus irregularis TaxID=588596 RepID=A0A2I1HIT0_9GLOM|nr:hypothetical protein RhiirA4_429968 [Rhizophagus irregularis]